MSRRGGGGPRVALGLLLSAVLLALLLRALNPAQLAAALASVNLWYIPPAVALYFVGVTLRSTRWGLLLPEPRPRVPTLFRALVVGFMINDVLPARLGEVARAYLLAEWAGVAYGASIASLVVERLLDGISLAVLLLVAVTVSPAPSYLVGLGVLVGGGLTLVGAILFLAAWKPGPLGRAGRLLMRPLPPSLAAPLARQTAVFLVALRGLRGSSRVAAVVGLSIGAWCCELSVFYVVMRGFPMVHSLAVAFLGGVVANFATLVPSSPGYVGTFDGALVNTLANAAGVSPTVGAAYALVVHATLFVPVVLLGALILWRSRLSLGQLTRLRSAGPARPADFGSAAPK